MVCREGKLVVLELLAKVGHRGRLIHEIVAKRDESIHGSRGIGKVKQFIPVLGLAMLHGRSDILEERTP